MTQLLRSCLARSIRDAAATVTPLTAGQPSAETTQRLTKHIVLVFERMGKGMRLSSRLKQQAEK